MKKIGMACDHAGYDLKEYLKSILIKMGYEVKDYGTNAKDSVDYPDFAHPLGNAIDSGELSIAVAVCYTGNGMSMALNRHKKVRSALCWGEKLASLCREHNNANVLSLPAGFITQDEAEKCMKIFLETEFEGGRHERRVTKINFE